MSAKGKKDTKEPKALRQTGTRNDANPNDATASGGPAANLDLILQELRDFRQDNKTQMEEIKEELTRTNTKLEEAEERIEKAEERLQNVEDIVSEMLKLHAQTEARLTDQESRSRRENIRLYGIPEGAERDSSSVIVFVEQLLRDNLDVGDTSLNIERAHRSLGDRPPPSAQPRSIVVKFASFRSKEMVLKKAWQKKGLMLDTKRINVDNDYPPRILQKRKEYAEVRKILKDRDIKFNTLFPARLKVRYQEGEEIYDTAEEATRDLARRGFGITAPVNQPETMMERLRKLTWQRSGGARRRGRNTGAGAPNYRERLQAFRRDESSQNADSG